MNDLQQAIEKICDNRIKEEVSARDLRIEELEKEIKYLKVLIDNLSNTNKKVDKEKLNMKESTAYLGYKSYNTLSSRIGTEGFPKRYEDGGKVYFLKEELDAWIVTLKSKE
ncbi:hypothetical protein [Brochothrix campestris]|uniref:Uncharacterized protein n=1 Tax=Brochothrix campestris FSL F6-1037 TaxID=1265861 RepID=W7CY59_9LIST|nr:hypothetical protein [Brochothrix campestris]EUJ41872.1 hypothetical protein BCAMP_01780 [Brochothrix campestris FSL F6-1037]